jgi:crotonobetainyl-CoA:carnitine CoA-transferase CaiB-like acyl-CoA transferase
MPPLTGLRVLDLTRVVAGPFCTMMLGDMGAEVLKIEEPARGDDSRGWAPFIHPVASSANEDRPVTPEPRSGEGGWSSFYLALNRSKKSVALDLKSAEGAAALRRLIERADVLIENFRPGSLRALGFGYDDVSTINPRLIYCSIAGFGQTGPAAPLPGYDAVIQGEAGIMDMTGFPDGEPTRVGVAITDYLAGLYASQGILLALIDRERSGLGQHVDVALFDAMLSVMRLPLSMLLATGADPTRVGNDHLSIAPYEPLRARDGTIIVAVANPGLWIRFCTAIGRPELKDDPRFKTNSDRVAHRGVLKRELETLFETFTVDELTGRLQAANVPCGRVRSVREAMEHPQVVARDLLLSQSHPSLGTVQTLAPVVRLSRTPAHPVLPPPALGEHTNEVLSSLDTKV